MLNYPHASRSSFDMVPLSPLQALGGRVMREALERAVPATIHRTAEAGAWLDARRRADYAQAEREDALPADPLVLRAVVRALQAHPWMNARLVEGERAQFRDVNLGVTLGRDDGLLALVLGDAGASTPHQLAGRLGQAAGEARAGRYDAQDMRRVSFLVADLGRYGVGHFTPLLVPGLVGVLGVGAVRHACRPVEDEDGNNGNGGCRAVPVLPLSLTFDHGAVDAVRAARFVADVADRLARPHEL